MPSNIENGSQISCNSENFMANIGFSGKQTLRSRLTHRMLIKKHLWDQPFEKGEEWSRFGQREKLNCDVGLVSAFTDPTGNAGARMALQSCPKLDQNGQAFMPQ